MKPRHLFPAILLAISLSGFGMESSSESHAESAAKSEAESADPRILQVQVEFVEMSHEALTKLLFLAKPKTSDATELRKQVQEMVAGKDAKVIETLVIAARSGQKATSESIAEVIYPTEYEPPELPGSFGTPAPGTPQPADPRIPSTFLPTAFDTRKLWQHLGSIRLAFPGRKIREPPNGARAGLAYGDHHMDGG